MFWQFYLVLKLDLICGELRFVGTRKGVGLARVEERRSVGLLGSALYSSLTDVSTLRIS